MLTQQSNLLNREWPQLPLESQRELISLLRLHCEKETERSLGVRGDSDVGSVRISSQEPKSEFSFATHGIRIDKENAHPMFLLIAREDTLQLVRAVTDANQLETGTIEIPPLTLLETALKSMRNVTPICLTFVNLPNPNSQEEIY